MAAVCPKRNLKVAATMLRIWETAGLMPPNLLQARRRVDGRRQRDRRRFRPLRPGGKRFPLAAAVDLRCRLPIDAAVRYPLQYFAAVNRAIHFLVGADDAILPRLVKLAFWV